MPEVSDMVNLFDAFIWIFGLIFLLAAGMGVLNTMLMATYERIREFGILKALGATPWRILRDVAAEALLLAALGTVLGAVLGLAGSYYLQEVGLDLSIFAGTYSVGGVAFDPIWRATISLEMVFIPVVLMLIISLVASLYPAALAARLDPVRAIHRPRWMRLTTETQRTRRRWIFPLAGRRRPGKSASAFGGSPIDTARTVGT
jgi:ABC-type antimicrobial peptide transport system permease subunit